MARLFKSKALLAIFLFAAFLYVAPRSSAESEWRLLAGAGAADMTPDLEKWEVPMNGYGARKKAPATGVHDPLYAKALALASIGPDGSRRDAVFVTTDLCMVTLSLRDAVIAKVKHLGYTDDNFFFTATHTHSGTASIDTRWPVGLVMGKFNPELFAFTVDRIAEAITRANKSMGPARADVVQGDFPSLVRNRRKDKYDYATRRFTGEKSTDIDPQMSVLSVKTADDKPMAMLVVLGSHPTILGPESMLISADWPGYLCKTLEARMGQGAVAMFANGAEGDQTPDFIESKDDFDWADKYGRAVADAAYKLAGTANPEGNIKLSAAVARNRFPRMKIKPLGGLVLPRLLTKKVADDAIGTALILGDAAFLGLPGEPLHAVVMQLREKAAKKGVAKPVVVGVANDWNGYLTDPVSYDEGGYETSMTLFGPEGAGFCIQTTLEALTAAQEAY